MTPLPMESWSTRAAVVVNVAGEIDATNAHRFEDYVTRARQVGAPLVLDLGGVTFMDSSGLHVLLRLDADLRAAGTGMHVAAVQARVARLLEITGMWRVLHTHAGVEQALAALAGPGEPGGSGERSTQEGLPR